MNQEVIDVAIIGTGIAGHHHAQAVRQHGKYKLLCCYDENQQVSKHFASYYGIKVYDTIYSLIETQQKSKTTTLAIICTPPRSHIEMGKTLAKAGIHLLVEKPFCLNVHEINDLKCIAQQSNVLIGAVAQHRYGEDFKILKRLLIQNKSAIKEIELTIQRHRKASYFLASKHAWHADKQQAGGGVLMTIGFHFLDLLCSIFDNYNIQSVEIGEMTNGIEKQINGLLYFDGIPCRFEAKWGAFEAKPDTIRVRRTMGDLVFTKDVLEDVGSGHKPSRLELHIAQLDDMLMAIQTGEKPLTGATDVKTVLELIFDIYSHTKTA